MRFVSQCRIDVEFAVPWAASQGVEPGLKVTEHRYLPIPSATPGTCRKSTVYWSSQVAPWEEPSSARDVLGRGRRLGRVW